MTELELALLERVIQLEKELAALKSGNTKFLEPISPKKRTYHKWADDPDLQKLFALVSDEQAAQ